MKTRNYTRWLVPALLGWQPLAFAGGNEMQVNPKVSANTGVAHGPVSTTKTGNITVELVNSCFGTNLRSVFNPLSPNSLVTANIPLVITKLGSAPAIHMLKVQFPGLIVTPEGMTNPTSETDPTMYSATPPIPGLKVSMSGNIVRAVFPGQQIQVSISEDGVETDTATTKVDIGDATFDQKMIDCNNTGPVYGSAGYSRTTPTYPCGAFMGKDGPLTVRMGKPYISSDYSNIAIYASFPGQTGFCGGFYSPLMLFFGKERPSFTGQSSFRLSAAGKTWWVEKDAPGYFLALDKNGNGKIDGKEELFGDQDTDENGFKELAKYDANHDGVIDAKDPIFKKLLLWNDKNGDGIAQPDELEPLSKRVTKISLKYHSAQTSYGQTARAREVGEFWFKDAKGKTQKGVIEDIWFAPINFENKK
jgi:hypothetical protein